MKISFCISVLFCFVLPAKVWDVVDKGLARGGVGRVPEGEDLEDAVAGLPPDRGPGEPAHESETVLFSGEHELSKRTTPRIVEKYCGKIPAP